jgi:hypothetical protein
MRLGRHLAALAIVAILLASRVAAAGPPTMGPADAVPEGRDGWGPIVVRDDGPLAIDLPVRLERGRIVVRAEAALEDRAWKTLERADLALEVIAEDLPGLDVPRTVEIRMVRDAADMQKAAPPGGRVPAWAAGVAYPRAGVLVVATYRGPSEIDVDDTVDHELAHLALGAALGDAAPRWLHEGFAYLHSTDWTWERAQTLAGMAWFGSTIPLDDLELGFPAQELPASRAYAQSYDFVAFLARRGRWADATDDGDRFPFQQFLVQVARTGDVDLAAQRAFGRRLPELFEEWRSDLKGRFMFLPVGLFLFAIWALGIVLLVLAWRRRRRQNRRRLDDWARQERAAAEAREREWAERGAPNPRLVPAVPVWGGPRWAPPGAPVSEPPEDDLDVLLEEEDEDGKPRPPPPPRRPPSAPN